MLDNARVAVTPRRDEHPVRHIAQIVNEPIPRKRGHITIGFLHDQIGRRKIPVAALATGEGRIQTSLRDPAKPKR